MSTSTQTDFQVPFEEIESYLPKKTYLYYVDQNDSLDDHTNQISACLKKGNLEPLNDIFDEWNDWPSVQYYLDEIKKDLLRDFEDDEAETIMDMYDDRFREWIREKDDSEPMKDLLRNTSSQTMFYDTGYYMDGESWCWTEKEVAQEIRAICRHLGIKGVKKGDYNWNQLYDMIRQASYGGELVVYFYEDFEDFCQWDYKINGNPPTGKPSHIKFYDAHLAIINISNGSGADCEVTASIRLPFIQERIKLCKSYKYSYTFDVCGMSSNWCSGTSVSFDFPKPGRKTKPVTDNTPSVLDNQDARDREYKKTWDNGRGKCTPGDMDITRHRHTPYINEFPCGHRCTECGTFWID